MDKKQTIEEKCDALARELYKTMRVPGSVSQYWDVRDDEREIDQVKNKILAIAQDAYTEGSDSMFAIITKVK